MPNAQAEVEDAPLDRVVEVVRSMNASPSRQVASGEEDEIERRRIEFVECELDLLKFDLQTFIARQPKTIALALARDRYESLLSHG